MSDTGMMMGQGPGMMPQGPSPEAGQQESPQGGNPLMPQMGGMMAGLAKEHAALRSQYDKVSLADAKLQKVRAQMDKLTSMGDTITSEAVVKGAGHLVAAGLEPKAMASLLADMPTANAEQLSAWIASHDKDVTQREAQLSAVKTQLQHQLGTSAMRLLMAHAISNPGMPQGAPPVAPALGMTPTPTGGSNG